MKESDYHIEGQPFYATGRDLEGKIGEDIIGIDRTKRYYWSDVEYGIGDVILPSVTALATLGLWFAHESEPFGSGAKDVEVCLLFVTGLFTLLFIYVSYIGYRVQKGWIILYQRATQSTACPLPTATNTHEARELEHFFVQVDTHGRRIYLKDIEEEVRALAPWEKGKAGHLYQFCTAWYHHKHDLNRASASAPAPEKATAQQPHGYAGEDRGL